MKIGQVDRGKGYNRAARKVLHIIAGLFALTLPFIPYWLAVAASAGGAILAYSLKPQMAWWLRVISKPADRNRKVITGFRCYMMNVLILVVAWPLIRLADPQAIRYVMAGWLALAWGDGLAGLLGPGPSEGRTVPWNRHKTYWGMAGCFAGTALGIIIAFKLPITGLSVLPTMTIATLAGVTGVVTALLESLDTPVDDNYLIGLGIPLLVWGLAVILS